LISHVLGIGTLWDDLGVAGPTSQNCPYTGPIAIAEYNAISDRQEYEAFVARYGLRRTSEDFWKHADWFNEQYAREQPRLSGIYDFNRYQNR